MKNMAFIVLVALAVNAAVAGAVERFRPAALDQIVLRVPARASNDPIALLEQQRGADPQNQTATANLAALYVERARSDRQPRYFGRAETLLQPWVNRSDASLTTLRVQADILQNRHEFADAQALLDRALVLDPQDANARLMRASVALVRGNPRDARADCAAVLARGESAAGTICLAQVLGNGGKLAQADAILGTVLARQETLPAALRGWALWVQADFADRRQDPHTAEHGLRQALRATPMNEGVRSALSDVLVARGALREALGVIDVPAPSVGLLIRRLRIQKLERSGEEAATRAQIDDLVSLASRRGEQPHLREEAMLALEVDADPPRALRLAQANFETQRETLDARLLARAAQAAATAPPTLLVSWLRDTGFEDYALAKVRR